MRSRLQNYRFATQGQWDACLFSRAQRNPRDPQSAVRPFPPYILLGEPLKSPGAHAPVVDRTGVLLWPDGAGKIHLLDPCNEWTRPVLAPCGLVNAERIVSSGGNLWTFHGKTVERYLADSLTLSLGVELTDHHIEDLAPGSHGSVILLSHKDGRTHAVTLTNSGHQKTGVEILGLDNEPKAFAYLRASNRFVILTGTRLLWFPSSGGKPLFQRTVGALLPCFQATKLAADRRGDRLLLAGELDGKPKLLTLDAEGNVIGDLSLTEAATGVATWRDQVIVTTESGLWRFGPSPNVPENAPDVQCALMTPMLESKGADPWLRIDATAQLPDGCSIAIAIAATDDDDLKRKLAQIAENDAIPAAQRMRMLRAVPEIWHPAIAFIGTSGEAADYSAPLFHVRERYLWVYVELTASPGGALPALTDLHVRYPGRSLMENLPSIYRRNERDRNDFLRGLVGVLETSTQSVDRRIAALGSLIHPATASKPWIDSIARWLGVPWDDAMTLGQKRAILVRSEELASARGTRRGLERLLECLVPGTPRRFRVTDHTADVGFAILNCSRLPALLGGSPKPIAALDSSAVLDLASLPCPGQEKDDPVSAWTGRIRLDIAATAQERAAWEPWLATSLGEMLPLTARLEIRWVTQRFLRGNRLDGTELLEDAPQPHLGTDAVLGQARLPKARTGLSDSGTNIGNRLI